MNKAKEKVTICVYNNKLFWPVKTFIKKNLKNLYCFNCEQVCVLYRILGKVTYLRIKNDITKKGLFFIFLKIFIRQIFLLNEIYVLHYIKNKYKSFFLFFRQN